MRLKPPTPDTMSPAQKAVYDEAIASKRGTAPPPTMAWLASPELAKHASRLGAFVRYDTVLPPALSELAILVTARFWTSHYEWYAHKKMALDGGLSPDIIEDVRQRRVPAFDDPKAMAVYDVARALHEQHQVPQSLYDHARDLLGERALVEIVGLCGYYTLVSMTLNAFEIPLPDGEVSELA